VPFDLAKGMIPEGEQALIAANTQLVAQYNLSISGKASTDTEFERNFGTLAKVAGDKELVTQQKQIMRESMIQTMFDASKGEGRPMHEILGSVIDAAKAKGASPMVLKYLESSRMRALQYERQLEKMSSTEDLPPVVADTNPATPDSLSAFIGNFGR
jgi:hypothetical protein